MSEKLAWQSVRWPDGSRYEGLVKDDACDVRGVFNYASGDRYMGEYKDNLMDGYGVYVWKNGTIYRGQWENSMQQGCGVKITKQPNGQFLAEEGEFVNDEWVGNVMGCSVAEARRAAAQADTAAQMAAVFELSQPAPSPAAAAAALNNNGQQKQPAGSLPVLHRKKGEGNPLEAPIQFVQDLLNKLPFNKK